MTGKALFKLNPSTAYGRAKISFKPLLVTTTRDNNQDGHCVELTKSDTGISPSKIDSLKGCTIESDSFKLLFEICMKKIIFKERGLIGKRQKHYSYSFNFKIVNIDFC